MIDRVINLISILCVVIVISSTSYSIYDAWETSYLWDYEWVLPDENVFDQFDEVKPADKKPPEKVLSAIKNAKSAGDYSASESLTEYLFKNYAKAKMHTRFNEQEIKDIIVVFLSALLSLLVPLSLNYVKNGKFRLWN